jgi:hypothetical protein
MLTVKLMKGNSTKIIEAVEVDIHPCGRAEGSDDNPKRRTNKVREIIVRTHSGSRDAFYVSVTPGVDSHAGESADMWDCAFIENAHGATTEAVHPY